MKFLEWKWFVFLWPQTLEWCSCFFYPNYDDLWHHLWRWWIPPFYPMGYTSLEKYGIYPWMICASSESKRSPFPQANLSRRMQKEWKWNLIIIWIPGQSHPKINIVNFSTNVAHISNLQLNKHVSSTKTIYMCFESFIHTFRTNVWYLINLHLVDFYDKCRGKYTTYINLMG